MHATASASTTWLLTHIKNEHTKWSVVVRSDLQLRQSGSLVIMSNIASSLPNSTSDVISSSLEWSVSFVLIHWHEVLHIVHLVHSFSTSEWEVCKCEWMPERILHHELWTTMYDDECVLDYIWVLGANERFTLTTYYITKIRTVNVLILAPLHVVLTVQECKCTNYWYFFSLLK